MSTYTITNPNVGETFKYSLAGQTLDAKLNFKGLRPYSIRVDLISPIAPAVEIDIPLDTAIISGHLKLSELKNINSYTDRSAVRSVILHDIHGEELSMLIEKPFVTMDSWFGTQISYDNKVIGAKTTLTANAYEAEKNLCTVYWRSDKGTPELYSSGSGWTELDTDSLEQERTNLYFDTSVSLRYNTFGFNDPDYKSYYKGIPGEIRITVLSMHDIIEMNRTNFYAGMELRDDFFDVKIYGSGYSPLDKELDYHFSNGTKIAQVGDTEVILNIHDVDGTTVTKSFNITVEELSTEPFIIDSSAEIYGRFEGDTLTIFGGENSDGVWYNDEFGLLDLSYPTKHIIVEPSIKNIIYEAFLNFKNTISVQLSENLELIDGKAFNGCTSLPSIEIPEGVTSIDFSAFEDCTSLTSVELPNTLKFISNSTFSGCTALPSIIIPDSVTTIEDYVFQGCSSLTTIKLPNAITSIGFSVFRRSGLTEITIPDSVTFIGEDAFYSCKNLTSIELGENLKSIGKYAFQFCEGLKTVSVKGVNKNFNANIFNGCINLEGVYIESLEDWYTHYFYEEDSNPLFHGKKLYLNNTLIEDLVALQVDTIPRYQFAGIDVNSVTIPEGVTNIKEYAFYESTMTTISIPKDIKEISRYALSYCTELKEITIPESTTVITLGANCFSNSALEKLIIKAPIQYIPTDMCYQCRKLQKARFDSILETINSYAFYDCPLNEYLILPNTFPDIKSKIFEKRYRFDEDPTYTEGIIIYYKGTEIEKNSIAIDTDNERLNKCIWKFYSETEPATNRNIQWHYVNDEPVSWVMILPTPTLLLLPTGLVVWDAIDNALKYEYRILSTIGSTTLTEYQLYNGETLYVKAIGDDIDYVSSDWSEPVTHISQVLDTPKLIVTSLGKASWNEVFGAISYTYKKNNQEFNTTETSLTLESGDTISVKAVGDNKEFTDSAYSAEKTFIKNESNGEKISIIYRYDSENFKPTRAKVFNGEKWADLDSSYFDGETFKRIDGGFKNGL